jgi:hypothetical protein
MHGKEHYVYRFSFVGAGQELERNILCTGNRHTAMYIEIFKTKADGRWGGTVIAAPLYRPPVLTLIVLMWRIG